jgi:hypothetical protein
MQFSKKHKKGLFLIALALILAFSTFWLWPGNISHQEATEIAQSHLGSSQSNYPRRVLRRFQRTWSVEVFHNGLIHEVYINVRTGEVVGVEN